MKTKILFGALLLGVALCSRAFSDSCCAPACCAKPACCEKACGCENGCGCGSGCCGNGHVCEWLKAVFTIKCKTCILCQNPPAPETPAEPAKTDAAPATAPATAPAPAPKTNTAPLPAAPAPVAK